MAVFIELRKNPTFRKIPQDFYKGFIPFTTNTITFNSTTEGFSFWTEFCPRFFIWVLELRRVKEMGKSKDDETLIILLFFVFILVTQGLVGLEMVLLGWGWSACISLAPIILFALLIGDRFWSKQ